MARAELPRVVQLTLNEAQFALLSALANLGAAILRSSCDDDCDIDISEFAEVAVQRAMYDSTVWESIAKQLVAGAEAFGIEVQERG